MFKKLLATILLLAGSFVTAQQPQTVDIGPNINPIFATNAKYTNGVAPGYWPTAAATGLTLNISSGTSFCTVIHSFSGGTLTMADNTTNYVYLNTSSSCIPDHNTTGFSSTTIPIAIVVTSGGNISSITDVRTMFTVGGGTNVVNLPSGSSNSQCGAGLTALVGALTDNSGNVTLPICVMDGPTSVIVPSSGRLQLGVNDGSYFDNTGSFSVSVSKNGASPTTVSVPGTAMPWNPSTNPNYTFGVNDGTSPVIALTGLTAGDVVTITYLSGTVTCGSGCPNVDGNGWLTTPPGPAGAGGPTGSIAGTFGYRPTKYMTSGFGSGSLQGLSGDVAATGPGVASAVVQGLKSIPFCTGFTPTNGQVIQLTTGSSPNPCWTAATITGSGLNQLTGDVVAGPGTGSQAATVKGINSVPLCTGFTPTNGQFLQYTTGSSPNPCYTAASGGGGGAPSGTGVPQVVGGSFGTTVDMGVVAGVPLTSDGAHHPQLANGQIATGGTGNSLENYNYSTIAALANYTTTNGYSVVANVSTAKVKDGINCGDTTVGGGSVFEDLLCTTVSGGACTAWQAIQCIQATPTGFVASANTYPNSTTASFSFSAIPAGRILELHCNLIGTAAANVVAPFVSLNGDNSSTNYDEWGTQFDSSIGLNGITSTGTPTWGQHANDGVIPAANQTSTLLPGNLNLVIDNMQSTLWKTGKLDFSGAGTTTFPNKEFSNDYKVNWRSTSTITSILVAPSSGSWAAQSGCSVTVTN